MGQNIFAEYPSPVGINSARSLEQFLYSEVVNKDYYEAISSTNGCFDFRFEIQEQSEYNILA